MRWGRMSKAQRRRCYIYMAVVGVALAVMVGLLIHRVVTGR